MKLKYWALSLLACGGMLSCSNNDDITDDGGKTDGKTTTSYLAVNIMNPGEAGSRNLPTGYDPGSDDENAISSIRFYLFDESGGAYEVSDGVSYVTVDDYTASSDDQTESTVEEVGQAILVINRSQDTPPAYVVAVCNPPSGLADTYTLTALKNNVKASSWGTSGSFVMSNSVYNNGTTTGEVDVTGHVQSSREAALSNPIDIYVERLAAKINVSFTGAETTIDQCPAYLVSGTSGGDGAIYAKIIGWTVVGVTNQEFLLKNIDASWNASNLGIDPWSSNDYHRSFWAMTPSTATIDNSFKFSDIQGNSAVYTMENTPDKESDFSNIVDNDLTKVVVRAQLVNASGTSVPRYVFLGAQMADENAVKNAILNNFTQYWIHTSTGYRQLQNSDLRFVSGTNISGGDSYRAYAQLVTPFADANTGNESTLYTKNATGGYDPVVDGVNTVNTNLQSFTAQIWTDGACYYTTTVPHLAKDTGLGQYGVVRNHSYVVNVADVKGFGTPVYDPNNDDIDKPVTPEEDYSYLAATINILSWKVVSSGVTLGK